MDTTTLTQFSSDELLEIVDAAPVALVVVDVTWRLLIASQEAVRFLSLAPDALGTPLWEAAPELLDEATRMSLEKVLRTGGALTEEFVSPRCDRWIRVAATRVARGMAVTFVDIHAGRRTAAHLRQQDEHYRRVLQQSGLVASRVDRELRYVWVDNVHPDFDPDTVIGRRDYDIADNEGTQALVALKREVIATRRGVRQEIIFPVGVEPRTYAVHGEPLFDENGALIGMTTVSLDVTDMRSIEVAARTDYLTGVDNRRAMERSIGEEIERTDRYGGGFSIVLLDIDHFKRINDAHGHQVGDEVLKEFVARLQSELRTVDRVGRWGGEEFLLLLHEVDSLEATQAAERLRARVEAHAFELAGPLTVSIGVATWRPGENMAALLARADAALYRAKQGGRNSVVAG